MKVVEGNYEQKYRLKNVIDKLEAIYCGPLYYAVSL
jgi:hypothetical protein